MLLSDQHGNVSVASHHHDALDSSSTTPTLTPTPIPASPSTRTVAIIKPHALKHRFEIEQRITEAKFEIVKERQIEIDVETDPDTLFELFGEDARSFAEGPVWVYILERRRAIEVWNTIMGDVDPQVSRELSPSSLRALYGVSKELNAVMGSPDKETAEIQIASLFVSSPPFHTSDLPDLEYSTDDDTDRGERPLTNRRSLSSSLLSSPSSSSSSHPRVHLSTTSTHSTTGSSSNIATPTTRTSPRTPFKARQIPLSHISPTILPRTTRAASLRAGVAPVKNERDRGPRTPPSKEALQKMFANVPGHKRTESIAVASTLAPVVAPRMTRAASLRISGATPPKLVRPKPIITLAQAKAKAAEEERAALALKEAQARTFAGVPGHKRRGSISVPSTAPPIMAPRQNRSAILRASKETTAPPTSFQFKLPVSASPPSRPASAQGGDLNLRSARRSLSRTSNVGGDGVIVTPPKPRLICLQAPATEPRQNRSAMLRMAKIANGV
ncbi:hypothetical protein B0F90DRAFT_1940091 [Multifurca ochricompacta]|uniref:Nucleoside diphosphate kinase n=1 Tax=Multifurca ochricompacta TaxID=376703 RepID=A0AAD4QKS5_9AGAM|nr:hypothetical protein B0F90DRAFT_1940091 [Multifurca ochricompacta]